MRPAPKDHADRRYRPQRSRTSPTMCRRPGATVSPAPPRDGDGSLPRARRRQGHGLTSSGVRPDQPRPLGGREAWRPWSRPGHRLRRPVARPAALGRLGAGCGPTGWERATRVGSPPGPRRDAVSGRRWSALRRGWWWLRLDRARQGLALEVDQRPADGLGAMPAPERSSVQSPRRPAARLAAPAAGSWPSRCRRRCG